MIWRRDMGKKNEGLPRGQWQMSETTRTEKRATNLEVKEQEKPRSCQADQGKCHRSFKLNERESGIRDV